jgi:hypothetical protein
MVRDADVVLGTGHLSPDESLSLLRMGRDMRLRRMLVTHPMMSFTRFTTDRMARAVELGAYLELVALSCHPRWPKSVGASAVAAAIDAVGPEHCVLSSDGGQASNPPAPRVLLSFAESLAEAGCAPGALQRMMRDNPAFLLDI